MNDLRSRTTTIPAQDDDALFLGAVGAHASDPGLVGVFAVIDEFLAARPGGQERLIPLLHLAQGKIGYLPFSVQEYIADGLGISPIQVYEVISFYQLFTTTPRGRHQLRVCTGTACFVRGAGELLHVLSETLDLAVGQISPDGLYNLDRVGCVGACGLGPLIMVGDEVHGNVDPAGARQLVHRLATCAFEEEQAGRDE